MKISNRHIILLSGLVALVLIIVFVAINSNKKQNTGSLTIEDSPDVFCTNQDEIESFEDPIPVVWEAEMDGCLVGCQGASFTRIPKDQEYQHSRFSGYLASNFDQDGNYSGNEIIAEEFRQDNIKLRVYGDWTGVDDSYSNSVFGGRCVPDLNITKIEIFE